MNTGKVRILLNKKCEAEIDDQLRAALYSTGLVSFLNGGAGTSIYPLRIDIIRLFLVIGS